MPLQEVDPHVGREHVTGDLCQQFVLAGLGDDGPVPEYAPPGERDTYLNPHPVPEIIPVGGIIIVLHAVVPVQHINRRLLLTH